MIFLSADLAHVKKNDGALEKLKPTRGKKDISAVFDGAASVFGADS